MKTSCSRIARIVASSAFVLMLAATLHAEGTATHGLASGARLQDNLSGQARLTGSPKSGTALATKVRHGIAAKGSLQQRLLEQLDKQQLDADQFDRIKALA